MTTLRQPYYELSPAVYNALVQAKTASSATPPNGRWKTGALILK